MKIKFKNILNKTLSSNEIGRKIIHNYKKYTNRLPVPDMKFPALISLETVSACNLRCVHCPPHLLEYKNEIRKFGVMNIGLFYNLMNEIDKYGERRIALHKDGEPLMHPKIIEIFERLKKNRAHNVYLTTNAHRLNQKINEAILKYRINIVNFSIGASTEKFYLKVRGNDFNKVIFNIFNFMKMRESSEWKPKVIVQIIELPEYPEMKDEIKQFRMFWTDFDIEVQVWEKLTWGVYENNNKVKNRYPCHQLWETVTVNSDGLASACCMDWRQQLIVGDTNNETIEGIWNGEKLQYLRKMHIAGNENKLPICDSCNYWNWHDKLEHYPL